MLWQIDENVAREIINHRSLRHPNIIRFKEVRSDVHFSILNFGLEMNSIEIKSAGFSYLLTLAKLLRNLAEMGFLYLL